MSINYKFIKLVHSSERLISSQFGVITLLQNGLSLVLCQNQLLHDNPALPLALLPLAIRNDQHTRLNDFFHLTFIVLMFADPPQVTLSLGSTLNPDDIKEGDDVYFECHIKANPKEQRITWSRDVSIIPSPNGISYFAQINTGEKTPHYKPVCFWGFVFESDYRFKFMEQPHTC